MRKHAKERHLPVAPPPHPHQHYHVMGAGLHAMYLKRVDAEEAAGRVAGDVEVVSCIEDWCSR